MTATHKMLVELEVKGKRQTYWIECFQWLQNVGLLYLYTDFPQNICIQIVDIEYFCMYSSDGKVKIKEVGGQ